jgi:hypothetical protein
VRDDLRSGNRVRHFDVSLRRDPLCALERVFFVEVETFGQLGVSLVKLAAHLGDSLPERKPKLVDILKVNLIGAS